MTEEQQAQLRSLEFDRDRFAKSLTKAGKEDGAEVAYARSVERIVAFHHAIGETGVMGVRRYKYRIGLV